MALRILAGIIDVRDAPKEGQVTIGFNPHVRVSGDAGADVNEMSEIGPAARFLRPPLKMIALRQVAFNILDPPPFAPSPFSRFVINDTITRDNLVVDWRGEQISFVEEISYLVIGEVDESAADEHEGEDDDSDCGSKRDPRQDARNPKG